MAPLVQNDPRIQQADTDLAYQRVEAILRAYGIRHAAVRGLHTQRILFEALDAKTRNNNPKALDAIAADRTLDEIEAGLARISPELVDGADKIDTNKLLLAIRRAQVPARQPEVLIEGAPLGPEDTQQLRDLYRLQLVPELRRRSMGAPTLRFETIEDVATTTTAVFGRVPLLRKLGPALLLILMVWIVYIFSK
ncbi:hypothetical protein [Coraliomargarita parva]|uniref:hypothetical protein n=1 Tax=Coraliomargarita parva TaxID=3014050 RepID=UPI0022B4437B|nr:hypothetical protein [Coraliomargarita parva]